MFSKTGYLILLILLTGEQLSFIYDLATKSFNITRVAFVCLIGLIIAFHIYVLIEINCNQYNIINRATAANAANTRFFRKGENARIFVKIEKN